MASLTTAPTTIYFAEPFRTADPAWTLTVCRNCDEVIVHDGLSWFHEDTGSEPCDGPNYVLGGG